MKPAPGERVQRFVGDRIRFTLAPGNGQPAPEGWHARLRTDLGRAAVLCNEIIQAHTKKISAAGESWHDCLKVARLERIGLGASFDLAAGGPLGLRVKGGIGGVAGGGASHSLRP